MNNTVQGLDSEKSSKVHGLSKSILRLLLYFDIFKHPLTAEEIFECCSLPSVSVSLSEIENELEALVSQNILNENKGYYFLERNDHYVTRRLSGESKAKKALKTAYRFSKLISFFPFVRGVYISGSLSKGYMDKETDIDYFIVTKPGRLWLSRSLLILFKKIFLLNSRKYFCVNYFVDDESLRIPDKNFFTATELVFIIPTCNYELYTQLMERNRWVANYYPNFPLRKNQGVLPLKKSFLKNQAEALLNGSVGEKLDTFFFRLTLKHWKRKFLHFDEHTFDHRLRSRKNVSKHHPNGFQEKILNTWEEKIDDFEIKYGIGLR